jgi:hypothetical protein
VQNRLASVVSVPQFGHFLGFMPQSCERRMTAGHERRLAIPWHEQLKPIGAENSA